MFYDLNIALPEVAGKPNGSMSSQDWARVAQTIEKARELGYSVVALNQTISGKLTADHLKIWKTMPELPNVQLSWSLQTGKRTLNGGATNSVGRGKIRVLRRVTAAISESDHGHSISGTAMSNEYDVVAVRPLSEKIMLAASGGSWAGIDLISLDMGARWGFFAKHKTVGQALSLGFAFEVAYQGALTDSATRQQWVSNTAALVRVTRGRGLVWTSGALRAFDLRSPYDVANLGDAVQLNADLSKRGVSSNARALLVHSFTRTGTLRAVVAASGPESRPGAEKRQPQGSDNGVAPDADAPNKRARVEA
ncbi:RNA-binding RNA processing protein rpp1 [Coemansia sp. RSA 2598]|nr:RNA-binding RNA processing protein rpp1 [Coemansia sp. RSA 2598]